MAFKLAILISGGGSNLQAIMDAIQENRLDAEIALVLSDNKEAHGLIRAIDAGIPTHVVNYNDFESKTAFETSLVDSINRFNVDLVVLAGFMRILGDEFVSAFEHKIVNIHPSILPNHKGLNTHQRVLDAGDTQHGATVHFVTTALDDGPIIIQATVDVNPNDTAASLQARVLEQEHIIYPKAISRIANGEIDFRNPTIDSTG